MTEEPALYAVTKWPEIALFVAFCIIGGLSGYFIGGPISNSIGGSMIGSFVCGLVAGTPAALIAIYLLNGRGVSPTLRPDLRKGAGNGQEGR
jgi:hypothetical protein